MLFNTIEEKKAYDKIELNKFLVEQYKNIESVEELQKLEFNQLLEYNQEFLYMDENPEPLEKLDLFFNHEFKIKISEILTPEIETQLIEFESDYILNLLFEYRFKNVTYDITLDKSIFDYYLEALEDQNQYFNIENGYLIISDLYNFLIELAYEDYYLEGETPAGLQESLIYEIEQKTEEIIYSELFQNQLNYNFMVYSEAKETYYNIRYDEINILNRELDIINQNLKVYLAYNESSTLDPEYYIKLNQAILKKELTKKILNPILNISGYYETSTPTKNYLNSN